MSGTEDSAAGACVLSDCYKDYRIAVTEMRKGLHRKV
jgi:hypothetical protein